MAQIAHHDAECKTDLNITDMTYGTRAKGRKTYCRQVCELPLERRPVAEGDKLQIVGIRGVD